MHTPETRTRLVIVTGLPTAPVTRVTETLLAAAPGTVAVHHDLRQLRHGVVVRRVRQHDGRERVTTVELAHGCVSCTLREDLLPVLVDLADAPDTRRIVLRIDPVLEPESICWALRHVALAGQNTLADVLDIEAVIAVLDTATWLSDATGTVELTERGLASTADDDRTLAQVAVGQAEFADALILAGVPRNAWTVARTNAVLDRLCPTAPRTRVEVLDPAALLARIPADARRGRINDPHGPVLCGEPPVEADCGAALTVFTARRPFHPERLHTALDVLLDGVVRVRGRLWVASQPDYALWLESAGGGLEVYHAGPWLAALDQSLWDSVSAERRALAALRWDPYYGDRDQELTVLTHQADPAEITRALEVALLTDDELAEGWQAWREFPDPLGERHTEPCADRPGGQKTGRTHFGKENA